MASSLKIGDNFWVNATVSNSEGQDFWFIRVTKPLHHAKADFTCSWGTTFEKGDFIVARHYYQAWGSSDSSYVLLKNSQVVYMHAQYIRAVKFLMPPKDHWGTDNDIVYELQESVRTRIITMLVALDLEEEN